PDDDLHSEEPESNFYADGYRDRFAVFFSGFKLPVFDSFHCLLVESHSKAPFYFQTAGTAVSPNDASQNHCALVLCLASFFGVLRLRLKYHFRFSHSTHTGTKHSAAVSTTNAI